MPTLWELSSLEPVNEELETGTLAFPLPWIVALAQDRLYSETGYYPKQKEATAACSYVCLKSLCGNMAPPFDVRDNS